MFEVRLDRSYYSKSDLIFHHLRETFNYEYIPWDGYNGADRMDFNVSQIFGYTIVKFVNEEDRNRFEEWIKTI